MNYRTLVALFLSVLTLSVHAEQRWFEVELLIFERNTDIQDIKEQLSSQQTVIDSEDSISMLKPKKSATCIQGEPCLSKRNPTVISASIFDAESNDFEYLDSSHLQLVEQRKKLEKHASFKPIFHMAWRMPVKGPKASQPIHLFAGNNLALNIQKRQLEALTETEQSGNEQAPEKTEQLIADIAPLLTDKWAIDGNFKVYLNHYLYINSQLIIRKEVSENIIQPEPVIELIDDENGVQIAAQNDNMNTDEAPSKVEQHTVIKEVLFDQNRRLRSEEIHYLDHPLMGIIVQIRKIPKSGE